MNTKILSRIELLVLVLILFTVFVSFNPESSKKHTYEAWEFFVDGSLTTGNNDGTHPDDAWQSLDAINWGTLNSGDIVYVKSQGLTAYTLR